MPIAVVYTMWGHSIKVPLLICLCITFSSVHHHAGASENTFRSEAFLEAEPIFPTFSSDNLRRLERQEMDDTGPNQTIQCTEKIQLKSGDFGTITSPNYPRHYPSALVCEWVLESPPGTRIEATFFDIFTQPWFFAYFDYILVSRLGTFKDTQRFFGDLNENTPMLITSISNKFGLRFRSSIYFNFRGFKLQYVVVPDVIRDRHAIEPLYLEGECGQSFILNSEPTTTTTTTTTNAPSSNLAPVPAAGGNSTLPTRQNNNSKYYDRVFGKIVGGSPAEPFSYPWMAGLLIDDKHFCGGSVIDTQHILTAAHCTDGARKISVLLGSHNLKSNKTEEPSRIVVNVTSSRFFQHPEYNKKTVSYDISIIRLPVPLNFTKEIQPICLPSKYYLSEIFNNSQVRVAGWGKVKDQKGSVSAYLRHLGITVMPNAECRKTFQGVVTGNNICAETKPKNSPCKGDSGGPMMTILQDTHGKNYFMQVGIVSFGTNSCEKGQPVGFTRVTAFLDYIGKITGRKI